MNEYNDLDFLLGLLFLPTKYQKMIIKNSSEKTVQSIRHDLESWYDCNKKDALGMHKKRLGATKSSLEELIICLYDQEVREELVEINKTYYKLRKVLYIEKIETKKPANKKLKKTSQKD